MAMDFEIVCGGLEFPEGPIAMSDGSVLLVETRRQTLSRVTPAGEVSVVAFVGGGPNGAAIGPDGCAYVCNNGGATWIEQDGSFMPHGPSADYRSGSIQHVDLSSGTCRTLFDACDGRPLSGPNDLVFDAEGGFWFTDFGIMPAGTKVLGALCYARADGSLIRRAVDGLLSPNGVGLSPDGGTVYVADTFSGRLYAFGILGPGEVEPAEYPLLPARVVGQPSVALFDSLAVQADGGVAVATIGRPGITIHYEDRVEFVDVPGDGLITNICFGGAGKDVAWITGSQTGVLLRTRWPYRGLDLCF
jgi:gluconolactonase